MDNGSGLQGDLGKAIKAISASSPDKILLAMSELFSAIKRMNVEELRGFHQALRLFSEVHPPKRNTGHHPAIQALFDAVRARRAVLKA